MARWLFGAGGDEFGGRFSGFGDVDVGGLDDVACDCGAAVGTRHGRVDGGGEFECLGVWLCGFVVVVSSFGEFAFGPDNYFVLWDLVFVFRVFRGK